MYDFTAIIQALLGLCATAITVYVIPWVKSKTTENQRAAIMTIIRMLVEAAEQLFPTVDGVSHGGEKLAYVKRELEKRGITIDLQAIEAMVYELRFREKEINFHIHGAIDDGLDGPPGK